MTEKTFLEGHAAAMVCHRREHSSDQTFHADESFDALADYADELAAKVAEYEKQAEDGTLASYMYGAASHQLHETINELTLERARSVELKARLEALEEREFSGGIAAR
jgi:hypothetical protein